MTYDPMNKQADIRADGHRIDYVYKGSRYGLETNGCVSFADGVLTIRGNDLSLTPVRAERPDDRNR